MADKYVYSGAGGTADGSSWANAYLTLGAAAAAVAAGDRIFIASDHLSTTETTMTFPGTPTNLNQILSVSRAGSVPPVAADLTTGAVVQSTAALSLNGSFYSRGVTYEAGHGSSSSINLAPVASSGNWQTFENSNLKLGTTSTSAKIGSSSTGARWDMVNSTLEFSNGGQGINNGVALYWRNKTSGPATLGTALTGSLLKGAGSASSAETILDGLDLSSVTCPLHPGTGSTTFKGRVRLIGCKLNAGLTIPLMPDYITPGVELIGCNSAAQVERNEKYTVAGALTTETTIIKTGGATDGATPYSHKVVSGANASLLAPFDTLEGILWNTATGAAKTLTVSLLTDNVNLTNADVQLEVLYLGDTTAPIYQTISGGPATILTAGSALAADASGWTTTGLVTPNAQKAAVSFTPQLVGPIRWRLKITKPSTTIYVDPNPVLS